MEELIKQFGLPVALTVFFIYQFIQAKKEHMDDIKGIAATAISTLDKNTEALDKNTDALLKSTNVTERGSSLIEMMDRKYSQEGLAK